MEYRIAVCDDEQSQLQNLTKKLSLYAEAHHVSFHIDTYPSAEAFLKYQDSINTSGDRIVYHEDGTATIIGSASKEPEAEEKV